MRHSFDWARFLGLVAPALVLLGVFAFYPAASALRLAFFDADGLSDARFVGLRNFRLIMGDELARKSLFNLLFFAAMAVPLQTFGPLIGAKLIFSLRSARSAYLFRALLVLPMVVPSITIVLIWREIYAMGGPLNQALEALGLGFLERSWLGNPATALPAIVATGLPWLGGVALLIYLGGYLNIPSALYEAARLDGARARDIFWRIELPLLRPQIGLITIFTFLGCLQGFEIILLLTNGGPFNATLTPALYLFRQGFEFGNLGYASALGILIMAVCVGLSLLVRRFSKRLA